MRHQRRRQLHHRLQLEQQRQSLPGELRPRKRACSANSRACARSGSARCACKGRKTPPSSAGTACASRAHRVSPSVRSAVPSSPHASVCSESAVALPWRLHRRCARPGLETRAALKKRDPAIMAAAVLMDCVVSPTLGCTAFATSPASTVRNCSFTAGPVASMHKARVRLSAPHVCVSHPPHSSPPGPAA